MSVPELANIPIHEEIAFFGPVLENTRRLLTLLERKVGNQVEDDLECWYAPTKGRQRAWKDIYLAREEWLPIRMYLQGKKPLLYYPEEQMRGLVNKDAQFWMYPHFEQLKAVLFREQIKIHELNPAKSKKIPFQNIEQHFQKAIADILNDEEKVYSIRAQECEKYLKLASHYLPKKQANEVIHLSRVLLKVGLHHEVEDLVRLVKDKVMTDMTKLKRRMRAVHTLSMKFYFFNAPDEEKRKIDCLIGRDKGSQLSALEYIEKKVARSFSISREKQRLQSTKK